MITTNPIIMHPQTIQKATTQPLLIIGEEVAICDNSIIGKI